MITSRSHASIVNAWKIIIAGCDKHSDEMDFAKNDSTRLASLLAQADTLNVKQEQMKADLVKLTAQLDKTLDDGNKIYSTLVRYAKGKYGPSSLEIKDFVATGEGKVKARKTKAAAR
jgi:hypothetical protein